MKKAQITKICKTCNKEFISWQYEDKIYCSRECYHKNGNPFIINNPALNSISIEKKKKTLLDRYGVDHPAKLPNRKEQLRKTLKKRYGIPNYVNHKKRKETMLEKYGAFVSPLTRQKIIERTQSGQTGFKSQQYKNIIQQKYGVQSNVSQSPIIQRKIRDNNIKKYGVEYYNNSPKGKQTRLNRYGYYFVNPEKRKETVIMKKEEEAFDDALLFMPSFSSNKLKI